MGLKSIIALAFLAIYGCTNSSADKQVGDTVDIADENPVAERGTQDFTETDIFTSGIEGPAVSSAGDLYVVNFNSEGTIGKVNSHGEATLFVTLPEGSVGNGIRFLQNGNMLVADYKKHNILEVSLADRSVQVWANEPSMNQPNDLAITSRDIVFASDPNWKESTGNLWRIEPGGTVTLLESDMGTTNGIEVSPDEKRLYVNESVQRNVWIYDLSETGEVSNKRLLIKFEDYGMDGMRCDIQGNLYITRHGKGTVVIISPEGELVNEIKTTGMKPSNIAFGGSDGRTCYITLQDRGCVETFRAEFPGRAFR
jgi:sugar lactone lactonase YvrE